MTGGEEFAPTPPAQYCDAVACCSAGIEVLVEALCPDWLYPRVMLQLEPLCSRLFLDLLVCHRLSGNLLGLGERLFLHRLRWHRGL